MKGNRPVCPRCSCKFYTQSTATDECLHFTCDNDKCNFAWTFGRSGGRFVQPKGSPFVAGWIKRLRPKR